MAKVPLEVRCPCCEATLKVDRETGVVLVHEAPAKPAPIEDLAAAVAKLKGEAGRRDELFRKQVENEKSQTQSRSQRFDELLKQAKEKPDQGPVRNALDLD